MAEFDEKLNSILGNQDAMSQIMALARSLSGDGGRPAAGPEVSQAAPNPEETPASPTQREQPAPAAAPMPDLSSMLGQIDPSMIQMGMRLFQEYQGHDDRNAALLAASDDHAPKKLRVNKVLQNFQEFFDTYGITEGDGMYLAPEHRVKVW